MERERLEFVQMSEEQKIAGYVLSDLSRDEKSILLYAETCVVDHSGLMEGVRMNQSDLSALRKFRDAGVLNWGRIPFKTLEELASYGRTPTIWVTFHEPAWALAHALRRLRARQIGPSRKKVDAALAARQEGGAA